METTIQEAELKPTIKYLKNQNKDVSPNEMISMGIKSGVDLKLLKEAMEVQFAWEKHQAEKAYNRSIADFKANPPEIIKESTVNYDSSKGKVNYKYASLANVIEKVTPELSKHGLTISWRTNQNGKINVTCRISHELGHYEETSLCADADTSGSKNPIQAIGSTITYMQRYTALALLGLACADQDDDGRASSPSTSTPITPEVVKSKETTSPAITLKDSVLRYAKEKFSNSDEFKLWRVNQGLVEDLEKASQFDLAKLLNYVKSYQKAV